MRCGDPYFCNNPKGKTVGIKRATVKRGRMISPYSSMSAGGSLPRPPAFSLSGYKGERLSRRLDDKN